MKYNEYTFNDKNFFKRLLQRQRIKLAYHQGLKTQKKKNAVSILDYGCGNAELCKVLNHEVKTFSYFGWDPSEELIEEAKKNLLHLNNKGNYTLSTDRNELKKNHYDLIFSLEVFEHLPDPIIEQELKTLYSLLKKDGVLLIQVPNEIFLSALVRGVFRMSRRYGSYDATINHVCSAVIDTPPKDRYRMYDPAGTLYKFSYGL